MNFMNSQIAMVSDPKAIEPKWYLKIHLKPFPSEAEPPESAVCVKYQVAADTARMNWEHPIRNALTQNNPNTLYKNTYLVVSVHSIDANGESGLLETSPTLQIQIAETIQ